MIQQISSAEVRQAFKAVGLKARVRDLGLKFRVCDLPRGQYGAQVEAICAQLGFTDVFGVRGGQWNGGDEFIAYKPGSIVRI